ncbi:hypothetical protein K1T71_011357 [Dendrolimus kikuchii]|uniref:Uncharacterized protein n=1 Tax=Dendrolimus kikuchii TaxID=765133 RepID=A0ACC1CNZ6_9NEOP|nr:hypothetical protein K1T71_011357 [Dendrolimus kikuchii]
MSTRIEISDDDDSFEELSPSIHAKSCVSDDSSGLLNNTTDSDKSASHIISDDDDEYELPSIALQEKKKAIIKNLFPAANKANNYKTITQRSTSKVSVVKNFHEEVHSNIQRMIGGIQVTLPVNPYGSQIALMSKVITAIKKGQNCLLESPTGSGKTLALLCSALAWHKFERNRITQIQSEEYFSNHPELMKIDGVAEYIGTPQKKNIDISPEKLFSKVNFGERSIYDKPASRSDSSPYGLKRQNPLHNSSGSSQDTPKKGEVKIHKKARFDGGDSKISTPESLCTPEKMINVEQAETPQSVRVPTIYYGARTHKQLQQVIKEFGRTVYCQDVAMTVLSSRDNSCLREFDRQMWGTREEMCKNCIKKLSDKSEETRCKYYDNRKVMNHRRLPPAFDIEDLMRVGEELKACPFYAARAMAQTAHIIFCPYNYLIEPAIRSSLQIDLQDNIVIIDEAHNIEDICRDSATFSITQAQIQTALKELRVASQYRYSNSGGEDMLGKIENLIKTLDNWNYWFNNQKPLLTIQAGTDYEIMHPWKVEDFVETLKNHNLGEQQFSAFQNTAEEFSRRLREEPKSLYGVTQSTGTLLETISVALGYLFRMNSQYLNDFKPVLIEKEDLSLRLICMNPAIVFEGLKSAKCIILASGTLTPLISLHSELATEFPLKVSPNHVIPKDRVWIGTLSTCKDGTQLQCKSADSKNVYIQDAIGEAILHVCDVTPHGVLAFLPSYSLVDLLIKRWQQTGVWKKMQGIKHVFKEDRNGKTHHEIMECYYKDVATDKGALLFAVYRGKVSEGMDFKDHQARAVITVGVPYPNMGDIAVRAKIDYNNRYATERNLLRGSEWLKVQAYRALNQAVGRCVRHRGDWGAVLLIDARFTSDVYTEHLSKWLKDMLGNNHFTFEKLLNSSNNLEAFMKRMTLQEAKGI